MENDIKKPIKPTRLHGLPETMRRDLKAARHQRGWSQAELGRQIGLPQMHISGIESGKIVPRFDTLLELVRVLGHDLLLIPRALVPVVHALIRDHRHRDPHGDEEERPLYATEDSEDEGSGRDGA
jgi:transcriptional regulator with XRE-family HTH domain